MAAGVGARLVFQPAEEVMPGGAEDVVAQDGLVGVDRIFALHCDPALDAGQVGLRVGADHRGVPTRSRSRSRGGAATPRART